MSQRASLRQRILQRLKFPPALVNWAERHLAGGANLQMYDTQINAPDDTRIGGPAEQAGAGASSQANGRGTMFQGWRFKLREAKDAFGKGRLEEARQLLDAGKLQQYLPGKRLAEQIAQAFDERAKRHLVRGDAQAAWRDLATSHTIAGETAHWLEARQSLIGQGLAEGERLLEAGDASGAIKRLETLRRLAGDNEATRTLLEVAHRLESADQLARRGKFADAETQLTAAEALRNDLALLEQRQQQYRQRAAQLRQGTRQLHQALTEQRWNEAVALSDELLELAPDYRIAKDARRRAWEEAGSHLTDSNRFGSTRGRADERAEAAAAAAGKAIAARRNRFVLWVDAVGGFLVCLDDEVMIGQAVPGNYIQVPIQGDLSRRHAKLRREGGPEGESYLLEPLHTAAVNGRKVEETTLLHDGDEVQLGGVRFRFRQPHALSASARLEILSRHRTQPSVDAVLLMAESCVLGPHLQNHVVCREWEQDVVLFRQDGQLFCRAMEDLEVDGRLREGRAEIHLNSRVVGPDFSLSLERLE